jgi:heme exporter protein C
MNVFLKISGGILVLYSVIAGFLVPVPDVNRLSESIRNVYFHVPMWFSMIALLSYSFVKALQYLSSSSLEHEISSSQSAMASIPFALIGLVTGSVWAKFTWGTYWTDDPKLNGVAATLLIYLAYFLLRASITDEQKKARISAVYNIFAYVLMIVFILILPRFRDSLHPGNGGNPAVGQYDMNNTMRLVFYPAVIGWIIIGAWITNSRIRMEKIKRKIFYNE